jgi:hypothetical protein
LFVAFGLNFGSDGQAMEVYHTDSMNGALEAKTSFDAKDFADQLRAYT